MPARVIAVVVHWRDLDDTLGAVASLLAEPGVEVIVVDNGSAEPAAERLAREAPAARCLHSPENLGYAGGTIGGSTKDGPSPASKNPNRT